MLRILKNITAMGLSLTCSLLLAELGLRLLGDTPGTIPLAYEPEKFFYKDPFREDRKLGWSLKPGGYSIVQDGRGEPVRIGINQDGSRVTSEQNNSQIGIVHEPQIILVGDSYMFGHGLHDEETLGWKLQERLSNFRVLNFGVGGYSTCQVLIQLRSISSEILPGAKVIYGLSSFHAQRNSADPRSDYWMAMSSPNHSSQYPFCSIKIDNHNGDYTQDKGYGSIQLQPARTWSPLVPLTGTLAISRRITNAYLSILAEKHEKQREVTIEIIDDINQFLKHRDTELLILLQDIDPEDYSLYTSSLASLGIRVIDGSSEMAVGDSRLSDGHPGPKMNWSWANLVEGALLGRV